MRYPHSRDTRRFHLTAVTVEKNLFFYFTSRLQGKIWKWPRNKAISYVWLFQSDTVEPLHPKNSSLVPRPPCFLVLWFAFSIINTQSSSLISTYHTERKPKHKKKKKTGEAWKQSYSNSTVKLIIVLPLVWLHRAMNCTQVYRNIGYHWLQEIYVQHAHKVLAKL